MDKNFRAAYDTVLMNESKSLVEDKQFVDEMTKIDTKTKALNKSFGAEHRGERSVIVRADKDRGFQLQFFQGTLTPGGSVAVEKAKDYLKEWKIAVKALEDAIEYCEKHTQDLDSLSKEADAVYDAAKTRGNIAMRASLPMRKTKTSK